MTSTQRYVEPERDIGLQGHYAGFVTRLAAFLVDVATISVLFTVAGHIVEYLTSSISGDEFSLADHESLSRVLFLVWAFVYLAYPLAVAGRTFGLAVLGLRVVRASGAPLDARHAVLRVVVFPLSFLLFGFGLLLILVNRDRRALHDIIAGTAVVYDWNARAARLRFLARQPARP